MAFSDLDDDLVYVSFCGFASFSHDFEFLSVSPACGVRVSASRNGSVEVLNVISQLGVAGVACLSKFCSDRSVSVLTALGGCLQCQGEMSKLCLKFSS